MRLRRGITCLQQQSSAPVCLFFLAFERGSGRLPRRYERHCDSQSSEFASEHNIRAQGIFRNLRRGNPQLNLTMIELDFSDRPYRLRIHAQAFLLCGTCPVPRPRLSSLQGSWTPRRLSMMCDAAIALTQDHALKVPTAAKRQYGIGFLVTLRQIPCAILL